MRALPWTTLGTFSSLTNVLHYHAGITYYRDIDNTPKAFITEEEPYLHKVRLVAAIDEDLLWVQHPDEDLDVPKPSTLPIEHYLQGFTTTRGHLRVKRSSTEVIEQLLRPPRLQNAIVANQGLPVESSATRVGAYLGECVSIYKVRPTMAIDSKEPIVIKTSFELPATVQVKIVFGAMIQVLRLHLQSHKCGSTIYWYSTRNCFRTRIFDMLVHKTLHEAMTSKDVSVYDDRIVTLRRRSCHMVGLNN